MIELVTGQRWISNAEPELGIGHVLTVEHRLVTIRFDLIDEVRTYARTDAPLTRVRFSAGDAIRTRGGLEIDVTHVTEKDGIIVYHGRYQDTDTAIIETDLDPNVTFSKPEERLFTQQIDANNWFNLRYETLTHRARLATLPTRGLLAPRVSLIPHQFYIAREVASRYAPRVLLADEVGLGKTIEAGLIIHQQLTTGRAARVLVVVPPALKFQWFVEMIRRFNLQFTLLDEARCQQIEYDNVTDADDDSPRLDNPFDAQQLVICSLDLFLDNPERLEQACTTTWDLVVVDEAHHLHWQEDYPGEDYLAVEALGHVSSGLLLLTATPEQLGRLGHFSRLRLLDPSRYHSYQEFIEEEAGYESIAELVREISSSPATAFKKIRERLGDHAPPEDNALIDALLDRHGTGRVLFRNIRDSVAGFMQRQLSAVELPGTHFPDGSAEDSTAINTRKDARLAWLVQLLEQSDAKFLVICGTAEAAITLEKYLRERTSIRSAAFHEGLDLVARDRAASYFSDTDRGAQVLVCSEIGSEGRNFQFANQLVMFDLPNNPDLLEQRIGRLDRIGQTRDIVIHVPWAKNTRSERLLRLFDEGFGIFTRPNAAAQSVYESLDDQADIASQTKQAAALSTARLAEMASGRDRLLELNSHRPAISQALLTSVDETERDKSLERYMEQSFSLFGLESEFLSPEVYSVKPTEGMVRHSAVSIETQDRFRYPELPDEGLGYTYHRQTALSREDLQFLTWEHPIVQQAMDLVASDVTGNNAVVVIKLSGVKTGTILVETLHAIDCVAPARLNADSYLPPSLVRSLITPEQQDFASSIAYQTWDDALQVPGATIGKIVSQQEPGIRRMLATANQFATEKFEPIRTQALDHMRQQLGAEVARLSALAQVNPNVRPEELAYLESSRGALEAALQQAQIRLEAIRLIIVA